MDLQQRKAEGTWSRKNRDSACSCEGQDSWSKIASGSYSEANEGEVRGFPKSESKVQE